MVLNAGLFIGSSLNAQWQRSMRLSSFLQPLLGVMVVLLLAGILHYFLNISFSILELMSFIAGTFILISYILKHLMTEFGKRIINNGSLIAHIGFGVLLIGIALNSNLSFQETVALVPNNPKITNKNIIVLNEISEADGPNFSSIIAEVEINPGPNAVLLRPEKRKYVTRGQVTSETDIHSSLIKDVYVNLGELNDQNQWVIRLQSNYFISFIWVGIVLMLTGILLFLRRVISATK